MKARTKTLLPLVAIMRRSWNFCQGGGVQARRPEKFYSLQRGSNGFITEKTLLFQGSRGGPTFSRGGPTFFKGENAYNL